MREKLVKIFARVLKLDEKDISEHISIENTPDWDSLAIAVLVTAIEKEFKIELNFEDLQNFTSFQNILKVVQKKRGARCQRIAKKKS